MPTEIKELSQLLALLMLEKEEDFEQYKQQIQQLTIAERQVKGYCWYPLSIIKHGYTYGERAFVVVEKNEDGLTHQFRSGKTVNLFTKQPGVKKPEKSGVIYYVNKNRMKIILNTRDLPDWLGIGQIGVDLLFDETTYQEMEKALKLVMEAKGDRLATLRSILLGKSPALYRKNENAFELKSLNPSQNKAVNQMLNAQDIALIHGPPGTGKTTTLVQAIKLLCQMEQTVLVCAPSNTAVDLLTERLANEDLNVVRIGNLSRVDERIIEHTLEVQLAKHPESKNIKKVKIKAAECRRMARRYKRNFGHKEATERKALHQEAKELTNWANQLEDRLIEQILSQAQVICSTLVGAANKVLGKRRFRTVVIDEAAQALEPATWIPITKAAKVVLTGDPFQLPPTVKSMEAQRKGFNITLLEKCLKRHPKSSLLNIQYRMNALIMGFSNQQFYANQLQAHESVANHRLGINSNCPITFIDTAGCGFEEKINEAYQSRYNPDEYQVLCEHFYQLEPEIRALAIEPSIAIISPYREQVTFMQEMMVQDAKLSGLNISVNTIDAFQGQESDVVFISLVRSNEKGEIGFLKDYRRMNVAMTRAKKLLVIVGDSATIGNDPFYEAMINYAEQFGEYKTGWEYMR